MKYCNSRTFKELLHQIPKKFQGSLVFQGLSRPYGHPDITCGVARSSSDANAISYVLPVLWMTSRFHVMERLCQNRRRRVCLVQFATRRHRGRSLQPETVSCYFSKQSLVALILCNMTTHDDSL